jgi:hypothetical protein
MLHSRRSIIASHVATPFAKAFCALLLLRALFLGLGERLHSGCSLFRMSAV